MSMRLVGAVLSGLLGAFLVLPTPVWAEEPEEAEVDVQSMVETVKKLVAERKEKATAEVPPLFGHYLAAAPAPAPQPKLNVPRPAPRKEAPTALPDFTITGIMKMGRFPKIFVGRNAYGAGESIEGAKIIEIKDNEVIFEYSGARYTKQLP